MACGPTAAPRPTALQRLSAPARLCGRKSLARLCQSRAEGRAASASPAGTCATRAAGPRQGGAFRDRLHDRRAMEFIVQAARALVPAPVLHQAALALYGARALPRACTAPRDMMAPNRSEAERRDPHPGLWGIHAPRGERELRARRGALDRDPDLYGPDQADRRSSRPPVEISRRAPPARATP